MANRLNNILAFVAHYKYFITIVIGVLIVGFLDENSIRAIVKNKVRISELQDMIDRYNQEYEHDSKKLNDMKTDPKAIERVAREDYFMKADDEDTFVLSDDQPKEKSLEEQEQEQNEAAE